MWRGGDRDTCCDVKCGGQQVMCLCVCVCVQSVMCVFQPLTDWCIFSGFIQVGDRILEVNGESTASMNASDLQATLVWHPPSHPLGCHGVTFLHSL